MSKTISNFKGFLRSKRQKIKDKKKCEISSSKEDETSSETKDSNSVDLPVNGPNCDTPVVDDEGYIIRPNSENKNISENHFYSSSDSDSEEEREQKIRIKINPLTNGAPISASVDELIASAGTLSLSPIAQHSRRRPNALTIRLKSRRIYPNNTSPTPEDCPIKRSISANHNISKPENDLITVFSPPPFSASYSTGIADQNQIQSSNSSENNRQKNPSADRYAALSDLFAESINESQTTLSKSMSASILGPSLLTSLPRPASKRNPKTSSHKSSHNNTISRCKSASNLLSDVRITPISVGLSRGPSPLTLGISEAFPIAIALQESVSACFRGIDETKCQVQIIGSLKMAFPAGIVQAFANNPYTSPLTFKLNKSSKLEKIFPNKELLIDNIESVRSLTDGSYFQINMSALLSSIGRLYQQSPNSRYYNIDVLKYQMRCLQGAKSTPLQLVSYWKCEPQSTSLKIDYKYNGSAISRSQPLRNVSIFVNIDGEPHSMQSRPEGKWNVGTRQALWRFDQISNKIEGGGLGSIKAKFDLTSGPSTPSIIEAQFSCFDTTLSGIEFELTGNGYRVSTVKKQFSSGRYLVKPNSENKNISENNFYSSSDSDSEEEREQKIRIKINPLTNGAPISASVDELIASAGTLSLSPIAQISRKRPNALTIRLKSRRTYTNSTYPTPEDFPIKRSISANHNISNPENDLITALSPSLFSASYSSGITDQSQNHSSNSENNRQKNSSSDRYAALSDLFVESINESQTTLSKSMSSSILGPNVTPLPRPASKRNSQTSSLQSSQNNTISRCESASSLSSDFRMTPISVGSSRGPSPLTLGITDTVPIAIALQESVSACFRGIDETKCQVQIIGSLKMAFPAGIVQAFANNPYTSPLTFKLNKSSKLEKIFPNKELLIDNSESGRPLSDGSVFEINMSALLSNIRRLYEHSPNSRYYNIDVLKYQMRCLQGAKSTPLQLVSYWKCEPQSTSLKIDYKYNGSAISRSQPLRNVSIFVNIDGEPHSMQSRPEGKWNVGTRQALWRFEQISNKIEGGGLGSIKAKFDLSSGPSTPSIIQAQFSCFDTTLSGIEFELTGMGYRVSLVKKQFASGRYICES